MGRLIKVQEKFAIVDDEYYEILKEYTWWLHRRRTNFYAYTTIKGKNIRMHHMIIGRPINNFITDHIDGNGLNNKKENLRIVTKRENAQNLKIKKTSMFPGVSWSKFAKKWASKIWVNGKNRHIGLFVKEEDASMAYEKHCLTLLNGSG